MNRERGFRQALSLVISAPFRLLPTLPLEWLYASIILAFPLTVFLAQKRFVETLLVTPASRTVWLDSLTYWLDPLLIQGVWLVCIVALMLWYLRVNRPDESRLSILVVCIFPIALFLSIYLSEQRLIKPSFAYASPGAEVSLREPWLTRPVDSAMSNVLGALRGRPSDPDVGDAPSGFALRQLVFFYTAAWVTSQPNFPRLWRLSRRMTVGLVQLMNALVLLWVLFSRLYRASHYIFGIGIAIGIATFFFWALMVCSYVGFSRRYREQLSELVAVYFAYAFLFFFVSHDASYWMLISIAILFLFGVLYLR